MREPPPDTAASFGPADLGDLFLIGMLFFLNLMPVAGELSGIGRWSPGIVGFATLAAILTGRELWAQIRARISERHRQGRGTPSLGARLRACAPPSHES